MRKELPYRRADRIGDLIMREISDMLIKGIKDPRVGFATVTAVKVSDDIRHATVLVSVVGSEETKKQTLKGLTSASGYIQHEIGRRLRLKYTPEIRIQFDDSLEKAAHMDDLLKSLHKDST